MPFKTLGEEWDYFAERMFQGRVERGSVQWNCMCDAFYAGAIVVLLHCKAMGEPEVPEHIGVEHLQALINEGEAYALANQARR